MSHSPEPWKYEAWCDGPVQIVDATGAPVVGVVVEFNGFAKPVMPQVSDLDRIVACVNACQGVSTHELIKIALWKSTIADSAAAAAATLLSDLGWKITDPAGNPWS